MKITLLLLTILITLSSPKPENCECEGQIKYYWKGKLQMEITFKKEFYIQGEDCQIVRGEQIRFDSIVIREQQK